MLSIPWRLKMDMKQSEGFVVPSQKHRVYKPIKSLYGLKQTPKQWHQNYWGGYRK